MLGAQTAMTQTVKVGNIEATANKEMEIVVTADANINNYIATGFYVELPEGFSVAGVEGVKGNAVQSNHIVRLGQTGDSKVRVAVYSLANSFFDIEGASSTICTLKLRAPDKEGSFTGRISGLEFASANHALIKESVSQFSINLKSDKLRGDVNGDGYLTMADVSALVDFIMGKNPSPFDKKLADVNKDGDINVADVTELLKVFNTEYFIDDPIDDSFEDF